MLKRALPIFIAIVIYLMGASAFAQDDKTAGAVIDIHSNISDGLYSPQRIAELAKEKGFSVLVFSDSALRKWEYGLWPLRNIIKKTYQENSVLRLGVDRYLKLLTNVNKKFPDLALIPAVEVSPFFYWEGSPFEKNFALIDYYKQLLVLGLKPQDYQNLPIVGNRRFFYFSKNALFSLWPIFLIIFGLRLLKQKAIGISLLVIGVISLSNNFPFSTSRFNLYRGYQGIKPYQDLIDYVEQKGGLIFWAHPEMLSQKVYFYGIEFYTAPHIEDLLLTQGYTGFGVSPKMAEPGNIWDRMLLEYLEGKRRKPAWIIDAQHTDFAKVIDYAKTFFFIKALKPEEIIGALRQGRMYVRFRLKDEPADLVLNDFKVINTGSGSIQIIIKGNQISVSEPIKIELIRNGQFFKNFEETASDWVITTQDNLSAKERGAYYRLRISNRRSLILSNPIFVNNAKKTF